MQTKTHKQNTVSSGAIRTKNTTKTKQVKKSAPLCTFEAFRGAKRNKWETHFGEEN